MPGFVHRIRRPDASLGRRGPCAGAYGHPARISRPGLDFWSLWNRMRALRRADPATDAEA